MQSDASSLPVTSTYFPATQSIHVLSVEDELYCPIAHAMQLVPLAASPTPVSEPAEQSAQPVVESGLYLPAEHAVQDDAPVDAPVFVSDPGGHSAQSTVETALYRPAAQGVQLVALSALKVSVVEPTPHESQLAQPAGLSQYCPLGQTEHVSPNCPAAHCGAGGGVTCPAAPLIITPAKSTITARCAVDPCLALRVLVRRRHVSATLTAAVLMAEGRTGR
jgi:hypothetical protein